MSNCITNCFIVEGYDSAGCSENVGGVIEIYLAPYCEFEFSGLTYSSASVLENLVSGYTTSSTNWYKYTLPEETASWSATPTVNKQNQTLFYNHQLTFRLNDWDYDVVDRFTLLAKSKTVGIAKMENGNYALLGADKGLSIESGEMNSGTALEDGVNVTIVLSQKSANPPKEVLSAVIGTDIVPSFV